MGRETTGPAKEAPTSRNCVKSPTNTFNVIIVVVIFIIIVIVIVVVVVVIVVVVIVAEAEGVVAD